MSAVAEVLRKARELYAANPSHAAITSEPEPGCVCLITATTTARIALSLDMRDELDADVALRKATGCPASIIRWNATHSTDEALAAFDRAIASVSS